MTPSYTPTAQDNLRAYTRVLEAIDAGRINRALMSKAGDAQGCVYTAVRKGKEINCAIGCLFSSAQLKDIKRRKLNKGAGVVALISHIGKANIQKVTGLSLKQATALQSYHDGRTTAELRSYVTSKIESAKSRIAANKLAKAIAC